LTAVDRILAVGHTRAVDEVGDELAPLTFGHVLLPLDGSEFALEALPTARALCARFGAQLVTISVAADETHAAQLRRHALESLGGDVGQDDVVVVVATDPAKVISAHAERLGSCLVCMSTRGHGRVAGTLIGSVARAVLQSSRAPMVAVGPQADLPPTMVGRPPRRPRSWPEPLSVGGVVACVDGSPQSEAVLAVAARWAAALDMRLSIVTVAEDAAATLGGERPNRFGPPNPRQYVEQLADRWREAVAGTAGKVVFDPIGVASGLQAHLAAQPAALVAVTTHARTGLDRIRLGATAADIVRTSSAPTLVVPLPDL
jgi:nucleotide-binding universal stress UspA family protein